MRNAYARGEGPFVKAHALIAGCRNGAHLQKKVKKFGMLVRPTPRAYIGPQLRFFWADDAYTDRAVVFRSGWFNWPIKNVAEFYRPVAALAKQVQRSDSRKGAHFVEGWSSVIGEELLNDIQLGGAEIFEYSEAEALRDRRIDAIKYCVRSGNFNPLSTAVGE
jgi:hypothetical protein